MRTLLTAIFVLGYSLVVYGETDFTPLNVKVGQWETKTKVSMSGMDSFLSQVPQGLRAQIKEQMLKSFSKSDKTKQNCLKKEDLKKASTFNPDDDDCDYKIVKSNSSGFKSKFTCGTGRGKVSGELTITAKSPEKVIGNMLVKQQSKMGKININIDMNSRFKASDCKGAK